MRTTEPKMLEEDSGQPQVTFMQLQEFLAVGNGLHRSCLTLPLTLAMWIAYVIVVFNHWEASISFESSNFVREAIQGCSVAPTEGTGPGLHLAAIEEHWQILPWISRALVPMLQSAGQMQQLLGFVRVSQTRGANTTSCGNLNSDLQTFYGIGCNPPGGVVGTYGPKRQAYEILDSAFTPVSGSRNRYEAWLEVNRSSAVVSDRLHSLNEAGWVDVRTQELVIDGVYLNFEANVLTYFSINFLLHREGWVQTQIIVNPLRCELYTHWSQVFIDFVWVMLFIIVLYQLAARVMLEYSRGLVRLQLRDPYMWLDCALVLLGGVVCILFWYFVYWMYRFIDEVAKVGVMPPFSIAEAPAARKVQAGVENRTYQDQLVLIFNWYGWFVSLVDWQRLCGFAYTIVIVGRFLRGFTGQPRMAVFVQTLMYSTDFIVHYIIVLAVVLANFTLSGYILFGEQVEGWSTIGSSASRMILVLFRRFDYEELRNVAPISSALWFTFFFVLVVLLLLRLLTAGILHGYLNVRERLGEPGMGIPQQALGALQEVWWRRTYEGAQKTIPYEELLSLLAPDIDPAHMQRLSGLRVDRRLRTRADLHRAEKSPVVDEKMLIQRGCDPATAGHLLQSCASWTHQISVTSSPANRLLILVLRHMDVLRQQAHQLQTRTHRKFEGSAKVVDRIDLKHAKSLAVARRIRKAQQLPPGWTAHMDTEGRRYLRQEETGLTSWTLPKHLL